MDHTTLFKVLDTDGSPFNGGTGKWPLPRGNKPGAWREVTGPLVACENGLHLARGPQVLGWLGPRLFVAEYDGKLIENSDKVVVRKARLVAECKWDDQVARLFAADCAEAVLYIYEMGRPGDSRPREAVEVARRFARGDATRDELDAARDAAWDAARDAARAAARAAAWAAARAAARDAAWDAARDAARDAAWYAARDAARDAARAAARAAAWAAEFERANNLMFDRLCEYLTGAVA